LALASDLDDTAEPISWLRSLGGRQWLSGRTGAHSRRRTSRSCNWCWLRRLLVSETPSQEGL